MGILDRIKRADSSGATHLKILLWGPTGAGKSTLCATAPRPILYLYTEPQGMISFCRLAPDQDTLHIKSMDDLREILTILRGGSTKWASICLDSFSEMQSMIVDEILAQKKKNKGDDAEIKLPDHMKIFDRSKYLARSFRDLPYHVVMTCLAGKYVIGDGENQRTSIRMMLVGQKFPASIGQYFNIVGYAYKTKDTDRPQHGVLLEGHPDLETKGMPGLRPREEPDIAYWCARTLGGAPPRNPEAAQIPAPSRIWDEPLPTVRFSQGEPTEPEGSETEPSDQWLATAEETAPEPAPQENYELRPMAPPRSRIPQRSPRGRSAPGK